MLYGLALHTVVERLQFLVGDNLFKEDPDLYRKISQRRTTLQTVLEQGQALLQELPIVPSPSSKIKLYGSSACSEKALINRHQKLLVWGVEGFRRDLRAVEVGEHLGMDRCPALAQGFIIPVEDPRS